MGLRPPALGNGPFRSALKATALVGCMALTARLQDLGAGTTRQLVATCLGLGAAAAALGVLALAGSRSGPLLVRLFSPGRAHLREILHVLSFFTFTDPGEVNWHAVDQWEGRTLRRSIATSVTLYVAFVLPAALVVDVLLSRGGPRLTLAAGIYLVPWALIRSLEERGREAAARMP